MNPALIINEETQRLAMQWLMEHGCSKVNSSVGAYKTNTAFILQNTGYLSYEADLEKQIGIFQMTPEGLKQLKDFDAGN